MVVGFGGFRAEGVEDFCFLLLTGCFWCVCEQIGRVVCRNATDLETL